MAQSRIIELGPGLRINTQVDGPKGAPWVVFSNSVMTDLGIWDAQVAVLAEEFSVLRYDQRGHGQSSVTDGALCFDDYGADLNHLLDAYEIETCVFVGLSMGVPTGLAALAKEPQRFIGFVAVDGVSRSAPGREAFWKERRETARAQGMAEIATGTATRWLPGEQAESQIEQRLTSMIAATPVEGFAAATHALQSYDHSKAIEHVSCPFLGIAGALDGAMPDAMRQQFGGISDAQFVEIADAGHVPNFQRPDPFNDALTKFLAPFAQIHSKEAI